MTSEDEAFEAYLRGATALSRRYREAVLEAPPQALEGAILEAAREAGARSAVRPLARPSRGGRRWIIPSTLAASVALCIGWLALQTGPDRVAPGLAVAPAPQPSTVVSSGEVQEGERVATPPAMVTSAEETPPASPRDRPESPIAPSAADIQPASLDRKSGATPETPERTPPLDEASRRLAHIDELLGEGEQDAARVMFYAFRERFPHHPIPDDLLPRLGM